MITKDQIAPSIDSPSLSGKRIDLAAFRGRTVLVKFHRFSGCPVARRQIDELIEQQPLLAAAGVETVVVLHSSADKVAPNFTEAPGLHIVPDRDKGLYSAYDCEFAWGKLISPASWGATFGSFAHGYFPQATRFHGGVIGVPADFLIDGAGTVAAAHYGRHFGDSWTAADVLAQL
jgi:peroxiredoxin